MESGNKGKQLMTNYRQTMAEAYEQVKLNAEANDFGLSGTLTDTQLSNLKRCGQLKAKRYNTRY